MRNEDKRLEIPQKNSNAAFKYCGKFVQKLAILKESTCYTNGLPTKVYTVSVDTKTLVKGVPPRKNGWETLIYTNGKFDAIKETTMSFHVLSNLSVIVVLK